MERYKNLGGNSNVTAFEAGADYIKVQFGDGSVYLYNYQRPGSGDVNRMKGLAVAGQGLNSYISRIVRKNYASKLI